MAAREKGRNGGGGFAITTPLPNELISICAPPASSALFFRTHGAGASCAAQTSPLWIEMKKLAVGAENWSIDTFSPSVDLGITSSRLFLPRPQIGHTRIAEGLPTRRQTAETDIPPYSPPPAVLSSRAFLFTQLQIFLFVCFFALKVRAVRAVRAGSS